jgi:hypothetical protein
MLAGMLMFPFAEAGAVPGGYPNLLGPDDDERCPALLG